MKLLEDADVASYLLKDRDTSDCKRKWWGIFCGGNSFE